MSDITAPITIARWPFRRSGDELRVRLVDVHGKPCLDVRVWYQAAENDWRPGKGLCCGVANLPALANTIAAARDKAIELKLVDQKGGRR